MIKPVPVAARGILAGGLSLLLADSPATASGFSVPELSALGTGTANAVVANPEETGAFAYNASAMGFHNKSSVALGAIWVNPKFDVRTASGNHGSQGADWFTLPVLQAALRVHEQWRIGIGIGSPFGLETRWKPGTFPDLSGSRLYPTGFPAPFPPAVPGPRGLHPTASKLELINITPTVVYKVDDNLSLGLGLDYYDAREAKLSTQITRLDVEGDAWGWNASALYRRDAWSFGVGYRSAATVDSEGDYAPLDPTLVALGFPPAQAVELDVGIPWRLQLGVRYKVNEQLAVEIDWTRVGWSEFDKLDVLGAKTGLINSDANEWNDANAYRVGLTYDLPDTATQLRFGYSYDETGQDEAHFSARVPDNDRHLFSVGVGQALGRGWAVEAAYMYVSVNDRKISSDVPYEGLRHEVNGTDALDGNYRQSSNVLAVELRKTF